jgi:ABC-2 type transport system permease protein
LGAAFPDFKAENPAQAVTGFGGLIFMILCAGFITAVLMLEAGPVYAIFSTGVRGIPMTLAAKFWSTLSFAAALALNVGVVFLPMRYGTRKLRAALSAHP